MVPNEYLRRSNALGVNRTFSFPCDRRRSRGERANSLNRKTSFDFSFIFCASSVLASHKGYAYDM
jgi:hypothetical protein